MKKIEKTIPQKTKDIFIAKDEREFKTERGCEKHENKIKEKEQFILQEKKLEEEKKKAKLKLKFQTYPFIVPFGINTRNDYDMMYVTSVEDFIEAKKCYDSNIYFDISFDIVYPSWVVINRWDSYGNYEVYSARRVMDNLTLSYNRLKDITK